MSDQIDPVALEDDAQRAITLAFQSSISAIETPLADYFVPLPQGGIELKSGLDAPGLASSLSIFQYLQKIPRTADHLKDLFTWTLGDFINITEAKHGDAYYAQLVEQTDRAAFTMSVTAKVCERFPSDKRFGAPLSFSHHKECHMTRGLGTEDCNTLLSIAHDHSLSVRSLRIMCKWIMLSPDHRAEDALQALEEHIEAEAQKEQEDKPNPEDKVNYLAIDRNGKVVPMNTLNTYTFQNSRVCIKVSNPKVVTSFDGAKAQVEDLTLENPELAN